MKISLKIDPPTLENLAEFFKATHEHAIEIRSLKDSPPLPDFRWIKEGLDDTLSLQGDYIWECQYTDELLNEGISFLRKKRCFERTPKFSEAGRIILPKNKERVDYYLGLSNKKENLIKLRLIDSKGIERPEEIEVQRNKKGQLCIYQGYKLIQEPGSVKLSLNDLLRPVY